VRGEWSSADNPVQSARLARDSAKLPPTRISNAYVDEAYFFSESLNTLTTSVLVLSAIILSALSQGVKHTIEQQALLS
jgi:hypothetical protein